MPVPRQQILQRIEVLFIPQAAVTEDYLLDHCTVQWRYHHDRVVDGAALNRVHPAWEQVVGSEILPGQQRTILEDQLLYWARLRSIKLNVAVGNDKDFKLARHLDKGLTVEDGLVNLKFIDARQIIAQSFQVQIINLIILQITYRDVVSNLKFQTLDSLNKQLEVRSSDQARIQMNPNDRVKLEYVGELALFRHTHILLGIFNTEDSLLLQGFELGVDSCSKIMRDGS